MGSKIIILSLVAILPTLLLCGYIYFKDRVEKEPLSLLAALFAAGGVSLLPAYYGTWGLTALLDYLFAEKMEHALLNGAVVFSSNGARYLHHACYSFICVALVGELVKWLALVLITKRNQNFNCLFDGIVYSVFVSLGYGVVEGIRYAIVDGWDSVIMRLLSLAPGYFLYGVIMGVFYTVWFVHKSSVEQEKQLLRDRKIGERRIKSAWPWLVLCLVVPAFIRGFSEFSLMCGSFWMRVIYYVLILAIYGICLYITGWFSKNDEKVYVIAQRLLVKKHSELSENEEVHDGEE